MLAGLLREATDQFASGRTVDAVTLCNQILKLSPNDAAALNISGLGLVMTGNLKQGIRRLEKAAAALPDDPGITLNLAGALIRAGRLAAAACLLKEVLLRQPSLAEAHNLMGLAYQDRGLIRRAVACFRRAIACAGDDVNYHENLINALLAGPYEPEALTVVAAALKKWPARARFHRQHATALRNLGRAAEAVNVCNRALAAHPGQAALLAELAEAHADRGEKAAACSAFTAALEREPGNAATYFGLAKAGGLDADGPWLDRLRDMAARGATSPFVFFALAQACEARGETDAAFAHLVQANRLERARQGADIRPALEALRMRAAIFGRALFDRHAGVGFTEAAPIFIVGMPRSGSTLVEQILACHSQAAGIGETLDILATATDHLLSTTGEDPFARLSPAERVRRTTTGDGAFFAGLGREIWQIMRAYAPDKPRIADKMLGNFADVGLLRLALPGAKVVHCRRGAMDTCFSAFKNYFPGHPWTLDLRDMGRYYRAYEGLMDHWRRTLPGFVHDVDYDRLTQHPETEIRALLDFLGLPFEAACLSPHLSQRSVKTASRGQVQQPVYRTSIDNWRRYERHLGPLVKALAGG